MWRAFQTAASESVASTVSVTRPSEARCWFSRSTTCWASDAFAPGHAPGVQEAVAPSARDSRSAGTAAATRAAAIAAATRTRADTRRRCAVSECSKRPLAPTVAPKRYRIQRGKRDFPVVWVRSRCRISSTVSASARVVRGACPHDCPDTCALLVEVDPDGPRHEHQGRSGAPDHGGLPVRQGLELPGARVLRGTRAAPARARRCQGRGRASGR